MVSNEGLHSRADLQWLIERSNIINREDHEHEIIANRSREIVQNLIKGSTTLEAEKTTLDEQIKEYENVILQNQPLAD